MARRILSSSCVRSPYPLLASTVVVPDAAILDDPQVLRRLTGARSLPAAKGEQFRRVQDQERRRRRRPFPQGGTDLVGAPLHPSLATPRESAWTTNAFPPAERIASAVLE